MGSCLLLGWPYAYASYDATMSPPRDRNAPCPALPEAPWPSLLELPSRSRRRLGVSSTQQDISWGRYAPSSRPLRAFRRARSSPSWCRDPGRRLHRERANEQERKKRKASARGGVGTVNRAKCARGWIGQPLTDVLEADRHTVQGPLYLLGLSEIAI